MESQRVVYVDVDAASARAKAAGAEVTEPVDQNSGSRDITVTDPEGNRWSLGTYRGAAASGQRLVDADSALEAAMGPDP